VVDGSAFPNASEKNPTLTILALSWRATDYLAEEIKRGELFERFDRRRNQAAPDRIGAEFFLAIKAMTINGYYTSEIGLRQELGDDGVLFMPQFVGCTHPEHQG
jgi:hypothetical protein